MATLHDFVGRRLIILPVNTHAREAIRAMSENAIGCVLVTSLDGEALGILTDRDLVCRWPAGVTDPEIGQLVSTELHSIGEDKGLQDVVHAMELYGIRRVPILEARADGKKRFAGIVTLDDLLGAGAIPSTTVARIVRRQTARRLFEGPFPVIQNARAEQRSAARRTQTLENFYSRLARGMDFPQEKIPELAELVLGALVRRLPLTASGHLVAQLPGLLRDQLSRLAAGPDRLIQPESITQEISDRFKLKKSESQVALHQFLETWITDLDPGQLDHLTSQLPRDFEVLFKTPAPRSGLKKKEAGEAA